MVKMKNDNDTKCGWGCRAKWNLHKLVVGKQNGVATLDSWGGVCLYRPTNLFPQKFYLIYVF